MAVAKPVRSAFSTAEITALCDSSLWPIGFWCNAFRTYAGRCANVGETSL
jgi:hypothetical protein